MKKHKKLKSNLTIYKNYQIEDEPVCKIQVLEHENTKLTFELNDEDDIIYSTYNIKGLVLESYNGKHEIGKIYNFKKRYIYHEGNLSTSNVHKEEYQQIVNNDLIDSFIKVDGVEIY